MQKKISKLLFVGVVRWKAFFKTARSLKEEKKKLYVEAC
jgi:hypothetical protein